jgi:hypothetical protein
MLPKAKAAGTAKKTGPPHVRASDISHGRIRRGSANIGFVTILPFRFPLIEGKFGCFALLRPSPSGWWYRRLGS